MNGEASWESHEEVIGRKPDLDLGDDHALSWTSWSPDRVLNPQYVDVPDVEKFGATVSHRAAATGRICFSGISFDGDVSRKVLSDERHRWRVTSWEPLTLEPSLLCNVCGDHGFVREGKWVRA